MRTKLNWWLDAIKSNDIEKISDAVRLGADVNSPVNIHEERPLHIAVGHGALPVVDALIGFHADVNAVAQNSSTPLHVAAYKGRLDVARTILEAGADPNVTNVLGWTPLLYAMLKKHAELVELLIARGAMIPTDSEHGVRLRDAASRTTNRIWKIIFGAFGDIDLAVLDNLKQDRLTTVKAMMGKEQRKRFCRVECEIVRAMRREAGRAWF